PKGLVLILVRRTLPRFAGAVAARPQADYTTLPRRTPAVHRRLTMNKYLVISALGRDRPGIVNDLSKVVLECGGNVEDSRMTVLGGEFALMMMVSGHWSAIGKLEHQLPTLAKKLDLTIGAKHTEPRTGRSNMVPYVVDVITMDHAGIVHDVADFFAARQINIEE